MPVSGSGWMLPNVTTGDCVLPNVTTGDCVLPNEIRGSVVVVGGAAFTNTSPANSNTLYYYVD